MQDREKVLKGLRHCASLSDEAPSCMGCPYYVAVESSKCREMLQGAYEIISEIMCRSESEC